MIVLLTTRERSLSTPLVVYDTTVKYQVPDVRFCTVKRASDGSLTTTRLSSALAHDRRYSDQCFLSRGGFGSFPKLLLLRIVPSGR